MRQTNANREEKFAENFFRLAHIFDEIFERDFQRQRVGGGARDCVSPFGRTAAKTQFAERLAADNYRQYHFAAVAVDAGNTDASRFQKIKFVGAVVRLP